MTVNVGLVFLLSGKSLYKEPSSVWYLVQSEANYKKKNEPKLYEALDWGGGGGVQMSFVI